MIKENIYSYLLGIVFCVITGISFGQTTVSIPVQQDASINAYSSSVNTGSSAILESYPWGSGYSRRFLVQFDLSSIPTGATITSAKVILSMSQTGGFNRTINAHSVTADWQESTVTWNSQAGQFNNLVSSSSNLIWPNVPNGQWDVKNDVQAIVDGTINNYGWLFKDSNEGDWSQQFWFFHSKEAVVNSPVIEITYETSVVIDLDVTTSHTDVSCTGLSDGTASVSVTGGSGIYNYSWNPQPASGQGSNSVSGLSAGVWELTITDGSAVELIEFEIADPQPLSASINTNNASCGTCNDGSLSLTVTGGVGPYDISVNGSSPILDQYGWVLINQLPGGNSFQIVDENGCQESFSGTIGTNGLSANESITNSTCGGNDGGISVLASGGYPPYVYSWSTGGASNAITNLVDGTYHLQLTDASGSQLQLDYEVSSSAHWNELSNVSLAGNAITKTSSDSWDGLAYSDAKLTAGENGAFFIVTNNESFDYQFGFTEGVSSTIPGKEYLFKKSNQDLEIYVNGIFKHAIGGFFPSGAGELRVERVGVHMQFKTNGIIVYSETCDNQKEIVPLLKLYEQNSVISNFGITYCHDNYIPVSQCLPLSNKMSSKVWLFDGVDLRFVFNEPYLIEQNSLLDVELYDYNNQLIANKATLNIFSKSGENILKIPCFSQYLNTPNKLYYLKFKNSKGEESYLQLVSPQSIINCN